VTWMPLFLQYSRYFGLSSINNREKNDSLTYEGRFGCSSIWFTAGTTLKSGCA
jgi:hypothetical protein